MYRKEDETTAQTINNLTAQITRKQEELRIRQEQESSNNSTIEGLLAQVIHLVTCSVP